MIGKTASMILVAALAASTAAAQVRTVDPNAAGGMAATGPIQEQSRPASAPADTPTAAPAPASAPAPEQPAGTQPLDRKSVV